VIRGIDPPEVEGYQWDGWKLIMIAKLNSNGTFHSRKWSCVWRPDIGSSLYARNDWMRAGGVGGLAWLQTGAVQSYSYGTGSGEVHVPLADHMGNVRHYYQFKASGKTVTGQLVASYEYDAFGREVRAWGTNTPATNQPPGLPANRPWADLLPFHYSSKLRDVDSGFNYYGYRFYDPGAGRWLNRDPIGEEGGVNLYGMVGNDPVTQVDFLGLKWKKVGKTKGGRRLIWERDDPANDTMEALARKVDLDPHEASLWAKRDDSNACRYTTPNVWIMVKLLHGVKRFHDTYTNLGDDIGDLFTFTGSRNTVDVSNSSEIVSTINQYKGDIIGLSVFAHGDVGSVGGTGSDFEITNRIFGAIDGNGFKLKEAYLMQCFSGAGGYDEAWKSRCYKRRARVYYGWNVCGIDFGRKPKTSYRQ
jgi:RHS repeat-associated protein